MSKQMTPSEVAFWHEMQRDRWPNETGKTRQLHTASAQTIRALIAENEAKDAEIERLREALTPSGETKAAYHGEFKFFTTSIDDFGDEVFTATYVPWDTVKDIMSAIRSRADLTRKDGE